METNRKTRKRKNVFTPCHGLSFQMSRPLQASRPPGLELTAPNALTTGAIALRIPRLDHEALAAGLGSHTPSAAT